MSASQAFIDLVYQVFQKQNEIAKLITMPQLQLGAELVLFPAYPTPTHRYSEVPVLWRSNIPRFFLKILGI